MTPEQLAQAKGQSGRGNELSALARAANGHGVSRTTKEKAATELTRQVGKSKAKQLQETELRRAGAKPKGLGRWF
jgi:50S ribosomal subunit-associated GTPase HflX